MISLTDGKPRLKYLFSVTYWDGSNFQQTPEDESKTVPGGSCFTDVKKSEIYQFSLEGGGHTFLVDLNDGHFEIDGQDIPFRPGSYESNGISFRMEQEGDGEPETMLEAIQHLGRAPTAEEGRRQIYFFRRRQHDIQFDVKDKVILGARQIAERCKYRIGWTSTIGSKTIQRVMEID